MVVRPSVEKWTRAELEDQFLHLYQEHHDLKVKYNEQEKRLKLLTVRLRRDFVGKDFSVVETAARCRELEKENNLLLQKLKTLKYQLLTYTRPSGRSQRTSALTSRSTARSSVGPPTRRPDPFKDHTTPDRNTESRADNKPTSNKTTLSNEKSIVDEELWKENRATRRFSAQHLTSESTIEEKTVIIKLNRQLREKIDECSDLTLKLSRAEEQFSKLRNEFDSAIEAHQQTKANLMEAEKHLESLRSESDVTSSRSNKSVQMYEKELEIVREEVRILRESNEKLVQNSLSSQTLTDAVVETQITLRKRIAELETQLTDALRNHEETVKQLNIARKQRDQLEKRIKEVENSTNERKSIVDASRTDRNGFDGRHPSSVEISQLYGDISSIIESHMRRSATEGIFDEDMKKDEQIEKWKTLYAGLQTENAKLRDMLLTQHKVNEESSNQVALANQNSIRNKEEYERKLNELVEELNRRAKRVQMLQNQIRSIAYSGQEPIETRLSESHISDGSNETVLRITKMKILDYGIKYLGSVQPLVFLSIEFFDFELETTPMLKGPETAFDYTATYDVVVSNLFIHYLETDGVTVELYRPYGGSYELCASGLISLREFLSPKQPLVIFGTLSLKSVNDGQQFAVLDYEVTLKSELATALQAQKRRITAASFLSLTNSAVEYDQSMYNTLIIDVHKCNNLNSLLSKSSTAAIPLSTYVVYQLYDFHPFLTNVVSNNSNPGYYSSKAWILPLGNELQRYLRTTELTFIVMSDSDGVNNDEKVNRLGIVNVPLYPLSNNKRISGTFPLTSAATNEVSDATIDISLYWKYLYEAFDEHIETAKVMDYVDVNEENESSTSKEPSSTSSSAKQSSEGVSTKEEQISLATRSESRFRPESRRMIENSFEDSKSDRTSHSEVISSNLIEDSENRGAEGDKKLMDTGRKMERSHEAQKGHITKVEGPATKVITVVPSERKKPATNNEVVDDIDDLPALNSPSSSGSSFITEMTPKVNDPSLLDYDKMITVETNSTVGNNDDEKSEKNVKSTKNERSHEENGKNANESMTVERNGESAESVSDKSDITVESVGDGNPTESVTAVGVSEGVKIEPPETSKTTEEFEKTIRNEANKDDVVSEVTGKNTHPQAKAKPSIAVAEEKKTLVKQSEVNCESAERVSASVSREEKKKDDRQNGSSSLGLSTLPPIRGSLVSQVAPASESTLDNLQRPSPAPRKPSRVVEFADPIHESISLSESVSYDSSTVSSATGLSDRGRLLEEDLDIPVISAASASQKRLTEESNESSNSLVHSIAISVNFLVLPEHSTLLDPLLSDFKFFIEWKLLDFPLEECETPQSLPLPNIAKRPINIGFKRRYGLNERRQKLLKQWVELGNKLEFTLVSDGGNLKECDDLGVAQLSLHPSNSGTKQLINIFDVNGDELAILEVQVDYSTEMLDVLTSG